MIQCNYTPQYCSVHDCSSTAYIIFELYYRVVIEKKTVKDNSVCRYMGNSHENRNFGCQKCAKMKCVAGCYNQCFLYTSSLEMFIRQADVVGRLKLYC